VARIDYHEIKNALKTIIQNDALTSAATVELETDIMYAAEKAPWVGIYGLSRTAPEDDQGLSAGTRTRYEYRILLVVVECNMESLEAASEARDDLLGKLEQVLMKDRTISGNAITSWLDGGELGSAPLTGERAGYIADAEIELVADVRASN